MAFPDPVQSAHNNSGSNTTGVGNTFPVALGSNVTAGNTLLFASQFGDVSTMVAIVDSGSRTWTEVAAVQHDSTNAQNLSIWKCENAAAGPCSITVTLTGTSFYAAMSQILVELPVLAERTHDTTKGFASNTTAGTDAETSNNITPNSGDLLVAVLADTSGVQGSITQGTGFTAGIVTDLGQNGFTGCISMEFKAAASGSAQNATFTVDTAGHAYTVSFLAFAPLASAPDPLSVGARPHASFGPF